LPWPFCCLSWPFLPSAKLTKRCTRFPAACSGAQHKDALRNSGKYGIIAISDSELTASYNIGGTLTAKRINSVVLNTKGESCEMQVQTAYSGFGNNDEGDFKKRVDESLAKLQKQPVPAKKPEGAPPAD
jgi:hypothetical protein